MDLQPLLAGKLLRLRPLRADDFEALYKAASDPLIWEQHPQPTRYQREVFKGFFTTALESHGALVAADRETGEVVGSSRYYDYKLAEKRLTIGYTFLARKCWGGAYNRELKKLMLMHAFRTVDTVWFEIGETNLRSRRAIEKIGAKLVAERPADKSTHVIYAIGKADYLATKP